MIRGVERGSAWGKNILLRPRYIAASTLHTKARETGYQAQIPIAHAGQRLKAWPW